MKTDILELNTGKVDYDREIVGSSSACVLCGEPGAACYADGPRGLTCRSCAARVFSINSARDPESERWETFWVAVEEGEEPRFTDYKWLKSRLRGANGKLAWKRYFCWEETRESSFRRKNEQ